MSSSGYQACWYWVTAVLCHWCLYLRAAKSLLRFRILESLPLAGITAALSGFLLGFPVLRLRGDYLAIVTLGFGEIVRILLLNNTEITGGRMASAKSLNQRCLVWNLAARRKMAVGIPSITSLA